MHPLAGSSFNCYCRRDTPENLANVGTRGCLNWREGKQQGEDSVQEILENCTPLELKIFYTAATSLFIDQLEYSKRHARLILN
jgi:hypothetical protein